MTSWFPGHVPFLHCRLIIILSIYVRLTLTLAKVCLHSRLITLSRDRDCCDEQTLPWKMKCSWSLMFKIPNCWPFTEIHRWLTILLGYHPDWILLQIVGKVQSRWNSDNDSGIFGLTSYHRSHLPRTTWLLVTKIQTTIHILQPYMR